MKSIQGHMKIVGDMIQGKREFVPEAVKIAGRTIASHAEQIQHKFPEGSIEGPSEATHSIWQGWDTFVQFSNGHKVNAPAMAEAAEAATDASTIRPHFAAVGKLRVP